MRDKQKERKRKQIKYLYLKWKIVYQNISIWGYQWHIFEPGVK